jgi:hypothetical protein
MAIFVTSVTDIEYLSPNRKVEMDIFKQHDGSVSIFSRNGDTWVKVNLEPDVFKELMKLMKGLED